MFNKSTLTITTSALVLMSTGVAGAASNPLVMFLKIAGLMMQWQHLLLMA